MMDPLLGAALIQGGANLVGGLVSGKANRFSGGDYKDQRRLQLHFDKKRYEEFERPRFNDLTQDYYKSAVKGAQAAGLHPLFAMGNSPQISSPVPVGVSGPNTGSGGYGSGMAIAEMGQSVANYMRGKQTAAEKKMQDLQFDHMKAMVDKEQAIASYYSSEAARNIQANLSTKPLPDAPALQTRKSEGVPTYMENVPAPNMFVQQPDVVVSRRDNNPSIKSGTHAAMTEIEVAPGLKMVVPGNQDSLQEIMSEANPMSALMVYNMNKATYGKEHARELFEFFAQGKKPYRSGGSGW